MQKHPADARAAIHKTRAALHRVGGIGQKTMRTFDALWLTPIKEMTPAKIRALRADENTRQTVFTAYLKCHTQFGEQVGTQGEGASRSLSKTALIGCKEGLGSGGVKLRNRRPRPTAPSNELRIENRDLGTALGADWIG
jgi:DNA-binding transcriptional regulator YiaG